ncbi:MAG TPA: hypothetical protein VNZ52_05820 [Candidatus Thermoplasmatota archaeon]|nr:hypothetical protein [Candidatus Thermoplasmatota archaeon]
MLTLTAAPLVTPGSPVPGLPTLDFGESRVVILDPTSLLAAARGGQALLLPTIEGFTEVRLVYSGEPVRVIHLQEGGEATESTYQTNIWTIHSSESGDALGIALLRADTLRARLDTAAGINMIEPLAGYVPTAGGSEYLVYRPGNKPRPVGAVDGFEPGAVPPASGDHDHGDHHEDQPAPGGDFGVATHTVTRTLTVYVDSGFVNNYGGMTWPDQARYFVGMVNNRMKDVGLQYSVMALAYDAGFDTNNIGDSWNRIASRDYMGSQVRGAFVYRDWDGCTIGQATQPGSTMHIQLAADACHSYYTPINDFDRYYLMTHEFAHNQDADHNSADGWCEDYFCWHFGRDITHSSAWHHYHDYLSSRNVLRMKAHLGTKH